MKLFTRSSSQVLKYAIVQLLAKALTLIAHYIIAIVTLDTVFGYITLLQATLTVVITFFGFNLQSAFVRYFFTYKLKEIFVFSFPIVLSLFISSLLLSIILLYFIDSSSPYYYFSILPLIGFIHGCVAIISMLARSNNSFILYSLSSLLRPLFIFIISIFLVFNKFDIVNTYIFSLVLSGLIIILYSLFNLSQLSNTTHLKESDKYLSISPLSTKIIFWYTLPLFITQVMSLINNVSDKYILKYYLDISSVGVYGKAYLFGSSLGLFLDSLMLLWLPYVIKNRGLVLKHKFNSILRAIYVSIIISFGILALGFYLYSTKFIILGLDPTFMLVFFIILSAFTLRIGYQVTTPILSAYDKTSVVAKISIGCMLLGLIGNLVFIPHYGIVAAAVATLVSFFLYSIISIIYTKNLRSSVISESIR